MEWRTDLPNYYADDFDYDASSPGARQLYVRELDEEIENFERLKDRVSLSGSLVGGVSSGAAIRATSSVAGSVASGLGSVVDRGLASGVASGVANGVVSGATNSVVSGVTNGVVSGVANGVVSGVAVVSGVVSDVANGVVSDAANVASATHHYSPSVNLGDDAFPFRALGRVAVLKNFDNPLDCLKMPPTSSSLPRSSPTALSHSSAINTGCACVSGPSYRVSRIAFDRATRYCLQVWLSPNTPRSPKTPLPSLHVLCNRIALLCKCIGALDTLCDKRFDRDTVEWLVCLETCLHVHSCLYLMRDTCRGIKPFRRSPCQSVQTPLIYHIVNNTGGVDRHERFTGQRGAPVHTQRSSVAIREYGYRRPHP